MSATPTVTVRHQPTGKTQVINLEELDWNTQRPLVPDVRECTKPRLTLVQRIRKDIHASRRR